MRTQYKNLALQGGGVDIIGSVGAYYTLEQAGLTKSIESVAGTSAGSILATLISMKLTGSEIKNIIETTNFTLFKDGNIWQEVSGLNKFGLHRGNVFLQWIKAQIKSKTGSDNSTFADFKRFGFLDLIVFASNMNTKSLNKFCYATTPNLAVCDAVRASMSIPLFFEAYEINGQVCVDGGLIHNYPIQTWDGQCPEPTTIGIALGLSSTWPDNGLKFGDYALYVESVVETLLNAQYIDLSNNPDNLSRSIVVNTCGISAIKFDLTQADKDALFNSGVTAAQKFLG